MSLYDKEIQVGDGVGDYTPMFHKKDVREAIKELKDFLLKDPMSEYRSFIELKLYEIFGELAKEEQSK